MMILYVSYVTINYLCSYFFFKLSMTPQKFRKRKSEPLYISHNIDYFIQYKIK